VQPQLLYIDALIGTARAQTTGPTPPAISALLGCTLVLKAGFMESGTLGPITDYTADSLRLVVKPADDPDAEESLFPAGAWAAAGSGAAVRYTWTGLADSAQLEALIGTATQITLRAQIEWEISTDTNPQKSLPFDLIVINSLARLDDGAPDVAGLAAKLWLIEQLAEGSNITFDVDPDTKVITLNVDLSAAAGAMTFKDVIDASANPNYPAATKGDVYAISVAGKIGGASGVVVEIGDTIVCKTTAVAGDHATVGTSWTILQSNLTGITSDGLALIQAASVSIQRGLLGLSKDVDGGVPSYTHALHVYAQRTSDVALNNVANATGDYIECTDSGQTFSASTLGTAPAGTVIHARFTGVNTLTHNASTFILPTGANITTAASDVATFRSRASGSASWICTAYLRADGRALVAPVATRVRGSGVLQGYTVAPVAATAPADVVFSFSGTDAEWVATYTRNGTAHVFTASATDPADGSTWIDTNAGTWDAADGAAALETALDALALVGVTTTAVAGDLTVAYSATGVAASHSGGFTGQAGSATGGGSGADAVAGSGHVSEVELVALSGSKTIFPDALWVDGAGVASDIRFALKVSGVYHQIVADVTSGSTYSMPSRATFGTEWMSGRVGSLVAYLTGSVPTGGSITAYAIADQV